MEQLEEAKKAVKSLTNDGNTDHTLYAMTECLLSIAISLDEKNKTEEKVREECRDQTEEMTRIMKEAQEVQKRHMVEHAHLGRKIWLSEQSKLSEEERRRLHTQEPFTWDELDDIAHLIEDAKRRLIDFPDDKGLKLSLTQLEDRKVKLEKIQHGKSL